MKDRINEFLVKENISPAEFADRIGVQRSSVSHVLNGRNYPGASFLQKMLTSYKNLNPRWLLLGEGMMMESKNSFPQSSLFAPSEVDKTRGQNNIPIIKPEIEKDGKAGAPISEKMIPENETNFKENTIKDSAPEIRQIWKELSDTKEIEKIFILYSDKSFTMYTPSK